MSVHSSVLPHPGAHAPRLSLGDLAGRFARVRTLADDLTCRLRRAVPWRSAVLLVIALLLPVYGMSGALVGLLGVSHVHVPHQALSAGNADPMAGWVDLRRRVSNESSIPHTHGHGGQARHHHAVGDATVVALDGALESTQAGDGSSLSASLLQVLAISGIPSFILAPATRPAWLSAASEAVAPWAADGPERPPKPHSPR